MSGEERRKHVRIFLADGQVRLASGVLLVLVGRILDLSVGGLRFRSSAEFTIGDELELEVTLPNGVKVKCRSRIAHAETSPQNKNEKYYGAQFLELGEKEQFELASFIMNRLPSGEQPPAGAQ